MLSTIMSSPIARWRSDQILNGMPHLALSEGERLCDRSLERDDPVGLFPVGPELDVAAKELAPAKSTGEPEARALDGLIALLGVEVGKKPVLENVVETSICRRCQRFSVLR